MWKTILGKKLFRLRSQYGREIPRFCMNRNLIALGVIASILMLCQWFVFQSFRKYLFRKRKGIQRTVAYAVLICFGLITIVAARLEFGSEIFPPGTFTRQLASVIVFSYMGWILTLTVVFLFAGTINSLIKLKGALVQSTMTTGRARSWSGSQRGCRSSSWVEGEKEEKPEPKENHEQCSSESASGKAMQIAYPHPTRRAFLRAATASGLMAAAGFGLEGLAEAYSRPVVEKFELFHDLLEDAAKPITLIHVTDCHFGMFFGLDELRNLVNQLNSLQGDALCITGDIFHSARAVVEQATPVLKKLKARPLGNFAVLGNHDFYAGEMRSVENLKSAGFTLLRNQWITFRVGSLPLHIGGVDDPLIRWIRGNNFPRFDTLMRKAPTESGLRILLSHRPAIFPHAAKQRIDLVLAGHTHGGQIVIPVPGRERGMSVADLVSEYTHGWYKSDTSSMYLNRGVGLTFLPWRIHCPPEIAVIQLKASTKVIKSSFPLKAV
jgi:uncharacterized protein